MSCCKKGKVFRVMDGEMEVAKLECTGNGFSLGFSEEAMKKHKDCCCAQE